MCQVNGHNVATNLSKTVGDVFLLLLPHIQREGEDLCFGLHSKAWVGTAPRTAGNTMRMEESLIAPSRRGAGSSCSGEPGFVVSLKVLRP